MIIDTLRHLFESKIVDQIEILEDVEGIGFTMLKIKVNLVDHSQLIFTEIQTQTENKYSYHWQTKSGNLLLRWDNAPHWNKIDTFPHHKHGASGKVEESYEVTVTDVLNYIEKMMEKGKK